MYTYAMTERSDFRHREEIVITIRFESSHVNLLDCLHQFTNTVKSQADSIVRYHSETGFHCLVLSITANVKGLSTTLADHHRQADYGTQQRRVLLSPTDLLFDLVCCIVPPTVPSVLITTAPPSGARNPVGLHLAVAW